MLAKPSEAKEPASSVVRARHSCETPSAAGRAPRCRGRGHRAAATRRSRDKQGSGTARVHPRRSERIRWQDRRSQSRLRPPSLSLCGRRLRFGVPVGPTGFSHLSPAAYQAIRSHVCGKQGHRHTTRGGTGGHSDLEDKLRNFARETTRVHNVQGSARHRADPRTASMTRV